MARTVPGAEVPKTKALPGSCLRDAAGFVGLVAALGVVFLIDRQAPPALPVEPDQRPAVEAGGIPELPPLPFPAEFDSAPLEVPPAPELPLVEDQPVAAPSPPAQEDYQPKPVDPKRRVTAGFGAGSRNFGLTAIGESRQGEKRLTLNEFGHTNHILLSVEGSDVPFFRGGTVVKDLTSDGTQTTGNSSKFGQGGTAQVGVLPDDGPYVVQWKYGFLLVEQQAEYEVNPVSGTMDALRIRYTLTNTDQLRKHTAGMRIMLDTFIGSNDGVPFFIPGRQGVTDKPCTFKGSDVPETVLALERNDLGDTTMTAVQLRLGDGNEERPSKLVLSQWPGSATKAKLYPDEQWRAVEGLGWDWQISDTFNGDSAVGIYYAPKELNPGQKRVFSFAYGLGSLSHGVGRTGLKLYSSGPFEAGKSFRISALVRKPKAGQTVTLNLPQGLHFGQGEVARKPVELQRGVEVTKVDWTVVAERSAGGRLDLRGELSGTDLSEKLTVFVTNPNSVIRELIVSGTPVAGGRFRLTARVLNARPGATVTLGLPDGLALGKSEKAELPVAAGPIGQASWVVSARPDRSGEFGVRVTLSDGAGAADRKVTVLAREPKVSKVIVTGATRAGGAFRVTAQVLFPNDETAVRLELPVGLTLAPNETAEKAVGAGAAAQPSWVVRAERNATGVLPVKVRLRPTGSVTAASVAVAPAVRDLTARLARDEPVVRGQVFWVVADVANASAGDRATIRLPAGFALAPGHDAGKELAIKNDYGRTAWPVVWDGAVGTGADLTVAATGTGGRTVRVSCRQGNLIQQ
jgi:hypothetical protein